MNGWLGQVSLRLVERGSSLGGLRAPEIRQQDAFLGQARLQHSYKLGRPVHLGDNSKCCNAPDGSHCFDETTGECINTWNSESPNPGSPPCVRDVHGNWVHPDCLPPPPPMAGRVRRIPLQNLSRRPMMGQGANCCNKRMPDGTSHLECTNPLWVSANPDPRYPDCGVPGEGGGTPTPAPAPAPPAGGGPLPPALSCPVANGKFTLLNYQTGAVIVENIDQSQFPQFSDNVTSVPDPAADSRCAPYSGGGPPTAVATGACALPQDKKFIMCPPSNGISLNYYLEAETANYVQNMTTQSPECANQENVIQVAANSPYCGGSNVQGPGSGPPQLVACFLSPGMTPGEHIVDVHNGPDFALLASGMMVKDIPTRFPGKRWIIVRPEHCSALPDFGLPAVAAPTPSPEPIPATGVEVLPPRQETASASPPTGAWPGQPFAAARQPVPMAKAPAPLPPPCPLGPVPLRRWVEGCLGAPQS